MIESTFVGVGDESVHLQRAEIASRVQAHPHCMYNSPNASSKTSMNVSIMQRFQFLLLSKRNIYMDNGE